MKKCTAIVGAVALTVGIAAAQEVPRFETFLGYEYVRFNSATNIPAFSANGGSGQFVVNFNSWLGAVADLGAVHNGNIGGFHFDSTVTHFLFGPRVSIRASSRFKPYFQVLFGGVYAASSTQVTGRIVNASDPLLENTFVTARLKADQTAFAMTAGGGLDIRISKHVAFRPIGLDYFLTRLQNYRTANDNNQNNLRYTAGVNFMFGGEKAAPPPAPRTRACPDGSVVPFDLACPKQDITLSLAATPSEVCAGETVQVVPNPGGASRSQLNYAWSVNGQPVSQDQALEINTTGKDPGTYTVGLTAGGDAFNPASAQTTITVREYRPPTGSVQANPGRIPAGDKSGLAANFTGQCGGPISAPSYEASEGTVRGDQFDSTTVQFDPNNNAEQRKTVTITAKASDNRSVGTATTTIEVVKAAVVTPIRLPDILFTSNSSRVNNCGKRILLEQLRAYSERDANGTVALVGHSSSDEKTADLAQSRAMNAAAVITAGTGVCLAIPATQVQVSSPGVEQNGVSFESGFCQSSVGSASATSAMRRVEVWFLPSGAQLPSTITNNQSASALAVSNLGCPK